MQPHVDGVAFSNHKQFTALKYVSSKLPCQYSTLTQLRGLSLKPAEVRRVLLFRVQEEVKASATLCELLRPHRCVITESVRCDRAFVMDKSDASYVEIVHDRFFVPGEPIRSALGHLLT